MVPEDPLVSVLMTAYNREKFIGEAIESVLLSTYRNFELIIVDDGSRDQTVEIAKNFEKKDNRIKVYVNEKNLGDYHNRNKALSYAKGKYVKYLDSDDIIYPYGLEMFISGMEKFPDAAVGIMSSVSQEERPYPYMLSPKDAFYHHFYKRGIFSTGPSALIFNADKMRSIGGFSGRRYIGDTEINLRLATRWPVVLLASSLIYWREHEGQEIAAGLNTIGYLESNLPLFNTELNNNDNPLEKQQRERILTYYKMTSAKEVIKMAIVQRHPQQAFRVYKNLSLKPADLLNAAFFGKRKY